MCPSTTKYFSPSFSYKATYPFPCIAMRFDPPSLPAHRPLFNPPVSNFGGRHTLAWLEESPVLWPHLLTRREPVAGATSSPILFCHTSPPVAVLLIVCHSIRPLDPDRLGGDLLL